MVITGYDCGFTRTKVITTNEDGIILKKEIIKGLPTPDDSENFAATGVFAAKTGAKIIVPEFDAAAAGLSKLSGEKDFLAVIIGTGTPFLRVLDGSVAHIGGTGVGGGTVSGLGTLLTGETDFDALLSLAEKGNAANVDLLLGDVLHGESNLLNTDVTAANFGNINPLATAADKAAAIFTLVFQTVFVMAALAARGNEKIVVSGGLSTLSAAKKTAAMIGEMYGLSFLFPENREYANALGAALCAAKGGF
jgi:type II pantothenate kinase